MALKKEKEIVEPTEIESQVDDSQGIEVNDPLNLKTELPLVVKLPADASPAQVQYAKYLNSYAYQNPTKWADKKDDKYVNGTLIKGLITRLKELKNAPDPVEDKNLKVNNSNV